MVPQVNLFFTERLLKHPFQGIARAREREVPDGGPQVRDEDSARQPQVPPLVKKR